MQSKMRILLIISTLVFGIGCGDPSRPKDLPRLYPATIQIVQEGKELAGAVVVLVHEDSEFKWNSAGTTDEKGMVDLHTLGKFRGVPAGAYHVVVSKMISISPKTRQPVEPPKSSDPSSQNLIGMVTSSPGEMPIPFNIVDKLYATQATTPLKLEVSRKKTNQTFDVGKATVP